MGEGHGNGRKARCYVFGMKRCCGCFDDTPFLCVIEESKKSHQREECDVDTT